jgi:hypothetical protein
MTDQDYIDNSICNSFIETALTDMSDAVIKQMIEDLHVVIMERAEPQPKSDFYERLKSTAQELDKANIEYQRKDLKSRMRHKAWTKAMSAFSPF